MLVLKQPEIADPERSEIASQLDRRILTFIQSAHPLESEFEALALALFEHQYRYNDAYQHYCQQRRLTPRSVAHWSNIPAVAAASFADARLATFPAGCARLTFRSSGTTRDGARPSQHELENGLLYDASLLAHFRHCVMPDRERMPMVLFSPPFEEAAHSSLAYMLSKIFQCFASTGGFFIHNSELEFERAVEVLKGATQPTLVFGTAFALMHFLDRCKSQTLRFALPAGSRIVETGGFKGKSRSVAPAEFYGMLSHVFGVPRTLCISEYGMCELGSQWYDANLADQLAQRAPRLGVKIGPHWARHQIVDRVNAQPVRKSDGLLQLLDLSNRGSVAAVLTCDLARDAAGGFAFLGRAAGAPPKGCSITIDTLLNDHA